MIGSEEVIELIAKAKAAGMEPLVVVIPVSREMMLDTEAEAVARGIAETTGDAVVQAYMARRAELVAEADDDNERALAG